MIYGVIIFIACLQMRACTLKNSVGHSTVDCIVFSYDRPLQLEAFLHSLEYYCSGVGSKTALIRCSNDAFLTAYKVLEQQYPAVRFVYQTTNPNSFYADTLCEVVKGPSGYLMFAVDDIIVTDYVDCTECTKLINTTKAHGFFLRLGREKNYSLIANLYTQPHLANINDSVLRWNFKNAQGDWACYYSVDMSIFPKSTIVPLLQTSSFSSPNTLEYQLHQFPFCLKNRGLCFKTAKIINFSLNIVREGAWGQNANISIHHLLASFNEGKRIDIHTLYKYPSASCHVIDIPMIKA